MTKTRRRKNPQLTSDQVLARARELLLDRDPGSMTVLLDLLEEQIVTLETIGEQLAPDMAPTMSNEMAIGRRGEIGYFELERSGDARNNRVGVAWEIKPHSKDDHKYTIRLWINWRGVLWMNDGTNGSSLPMHIAGGEEEIGDYLVGGEMENVELVPYVSMWIAETRLHAVLAAWRVAVDLKKLLPRQLTAIEVMYSLARSARWRGDRDDDPPEKVISNRFQKPKQNPAAAEMSDEEFFAGVQALLYDEDPESSSLVQDMLIERGWTLSYFGTHPSNKASEQLLNKVLKETHFEDAPDRIGAFEVTRPGQFPGEGAVWIAVRSSTGSGKFLPLVYGVFRGQMHGPVRFGRRFDTADAASVAASVAAWRVAMILKSQREADANFISTQIFRKAVDNNVPIDGLTVPEEIIHGPTAAKQNPPRTRTVDEQIAANKIRGKFIELLQDPEPGALDLARDLLLDNNVKLADLAHSLAVSGASNLSSKTRGWASAFTSGTTGELVLRGVAVDVDYDVFGGPMAITVAADEAVSDPDYISVSWMIWKTRMRKPAASEHNQGVKLAYTGEIQINYRGAQWIENRNGSRGIGGVVPIYAPIGIFGGSTLEIAERRIIDMAWKICRVIKMFDGAPASQIQNAIRADYQMPKTPPALINPPRDLRPNPPWVTHALADAFESLTSQVPPEWLPRLDDVRGGARGTLVANIKEYGCGNYGCVLPTLDGNVVLKVTTDETEAEFASQLAADLVAPICVEYYMAVSLAKRHENRPIYLLWREGADDVGNLEDVLGVEADELVYKQHKLAQQVYLALHQGEIDRAKVLLREWQVAAEAMGKVPELATLAQGLVRVYREQKVFFGDVHAGNLGRVFRGGETGQWIITDPGHVAVLR